MIRASFRPLTAATTDADVEVILLRSPVTVEEHLLHAWDALLIACRAESAGNVAKHDRAVAQAVKLADVVEAALSRTTGEHLANATWELRNLRDNIRSA